MEMETASGTRESNFLQNKSLPIFHMQPRRKKIVQLEEKIKQLEHKNVSMLK